MNMKAKESIIHYIRIDTTQMLNKDQGNRTRTSSNQSILYGIRAWT